MSANSFDLVAYYKGGRRRSGRNKNGTAASSSSPAAFDDQLPEGVDFSEGGWATDFAVSLVSLLFFLSTIANESYDNKNDDDDDDTNHIFQDNPVLWMYVGTGLAHFFGGLAHRFFPNRAADGVGMKGFYVTMVLGYTGNCIRYSLGWGIHQFDGYSFWPYIGLVNFLYMVVTATYVVCKMEPTNERLNDGADRNDFQPDRIYAIGELFVAIFEMIAGVVFLIQHDILVDGFDDIYKMFGFVAVLINLVGWLSVYIVGGCYTVILKRDYDPSLMQRIFHYCMIIMVWALNEYFSHLQRQGQQD